MTSTPAIPVLPPAVAGPYMPPARRCRTALRGRGLVCSFPCCLATSEHGSWPEQARYRRESMPKKLPVFVMVAALLAPLYVATAQQAKVHRVGVILQGGPYYAMVDGLRNGLRALGWLEGTHFVLESRDTQGNLKADEVAARALEREQVDLLYTVTTSVT